MLTRVAHLEEAAAGLRIMGLSPGTVATAMQQRIRESGVNPVSQLDPAVHIPADWPARALLWMCGAEADEFLNYKLSDLLINGPTETLRQTQHTQPAMFVASYAAWHYLAHASGKKLAELCAGVAGHSLGEFTALTVAGCWDFATGLRLVKARAEAMAAAAATNPGAMAAILGLPLNQVHSYCTNTGCYIANDNADGQVIIAGPEAAVDEASNMAAMEMAKKVMRLEVSGAFHTPLMFPAATALEAALAPITPAPPQVPVILNVTAAPLAEVAELKLRLVHQLTQPVRWRESMIHAANNGVTDVVELGWGTVLKSLAKRADDRLTGHSLTTPEGIEGWLNNNI
jgi:[acyl-carrier-protein] S-malonyltransferase